MKKEARIIAENINLFHIDIKKSDIEEIGAPETSNFDLKLAHTTMHNLKAERLKINLLINLSNKGEQTGKNEASFHLDFHFEIKDLQDFYELKENGQPVIAANLIATLLGISFSTARGIMYERLATTSFKGIILPVISPAKMLETKIKNQGT